MVPYGFTFTLLLPTITRPEVTRIPPDPSIGTFTPDLLPTMIRVGSSTPIRLNPLLTATTFASSAAGPKIYPFNTFGIQGTWGYDSRACGEVWLNMNVKHKFRGKKTFEDDPEGNTDGNFDLRSGMLRGTNYYWLFGWGTVGSFAPSAQPQVQFDEFLYFKDP